MQNRITMIVKNFCKSSLELSGSASDEAPTLHPLPKAFGEQGNQAIYFRGTRKQKSKTEGNRGTKAFFGNR